MVRRATIPPIAIVPIAYVVLAIASSYVIKLKEPRYLIAVVPMAALIVALIVDWTRLAEQMRGRIGLARAANSADEAVSVEPV